MKTITLPDGRIATVSDEKPLKRFNGKELSKLTPEDVEQMYDMLHAELEKSMVPFDINTMVDSSGAFDKSKMQTGDVYVNLMTDEYYEKKD